MQTFVVVVFLAVYAGMALGRWPGLRIDRTGIALLGAIALWAAGVFDGAAALAAIDFPTLFVLAGLMVLSAQFDACGFYAWCSDRLARSAMSPSLILALTIAVAGVLAAVLANDVVVFAMAPMLCRGLLERGLDPRPFLIGLAGAANAGSAATVIGNPQNILIGQVLDLHFWRFAAVCAPPAVVALLLVWAVVAWQWRHVLAERGRAAPAAPPRLDRLGLAKAVLATALLLAGFASPIAPEEAVLLVAGYLLVSRRLATRQLLGLVDWHLLVLFAGLFLVTASLAATGLPGELMAGLTAAGLGPDRLAVLAPLALVGSNTIGNVPVVMLLLQIVDRLPEHAGYALAVLSTLAGNLLIVGSFANIITAERAREAGVELGFAVHARSGVPMTLLSLAAALGWFAWLGAVRW